MATANSLEVNHMPFVMVIMMAASCGFASPIGYQTNLMVFGPGVTTFAILYALGDC
jgi:di/tricarboxylate transporter